MKLSGTTIKKLLLRVLLFNIAIFFFYTIAPARPEKVKPGLTYHAEDYVVQGETKELTQEKNYEEVYRNYEYFEAKYNKNAQIIEMKAVKRGETNWIERYYYNAEGELVKKEVFKPYAPDKPPVVKHYSKSSWYSAIVVYLKRLMSW